MSLHINPLRSASISGELAPRLIEQPSSVHSCEVSQTEPVSQFAQGGNLSDGEREAAIVRAGKAVEKHMARGEREDAQRALRSMEQLIAGRSLEQQERMQARIERGISADACYFVASGERDRLALGKGVGRV